MREAVGRAHLRRVRRRRSDGGGRRRDYRDHRLEWMLESGGIAVVLAGLLDGNIRFPSPEA
ncbi:MULTISPECIES: hypothetical protein [Methylobacteriaceae]|uniref:hypothetical protein n=1 Tax=Methylobacteriaceae TaxID=119045 RepID=UPI001FDEC20F|nr:hypothetical protein [Methylobacterium sp. B4]